MSGDFHPVETLETSRRARIIFCVVLYPALVRTRTSLLAAMSTRTLTRLAGSTSLRLLPSLRHMSASVAQPCPWTVLGLLPGTEKRKIKDRFYELAKETHPDVVKVEAGEEASAEMPSFVEVLAAFEALMDGSASSNGAGGASSSEGASRSSRSGRGFGGFGYRTAANGVRVAREPTLGEVLCARLREEPEAALDVWAEIKERGLEVRETMLESLFQACGSATGTEKGLGLEAALRVLRDAKGAGLLTPQKQQAACISLIKWCKEDSASFGRIMREFDDGEGLDLEGRDTLAYANALYSGMSDGYGASKI